MITLSSIDSHGKMSEKTILTLSNTIMNVFVGVGFKLEFISVLHEDRGIIELQRLLSPVLTTHYDPQKGFSEEDFKLLFLRSREYFQNFISARFEIFPRFRDRLAHVKLSLPDNFTLIEE